MGSNTPMRLNTDEEPDCATPKANDKSTPIVGMIFDSEESAYEFYNNYARIKGFSVRKDWVNHSTVTGLVTSRKFSCSKEGLRCKNSTVKYPRKEQRTGCSAYMTISLQSNKQYAVNNLEEKHSHELVTPSKTHLLRSQRKITFAQSVEVDLAAKSGLTPKEIYDLMCRLAGGRENLGFIRVDLQNHLLKNRNYDLKLGLVGSLLHYFQEKKATDPLFHFSVQLDHNEQITNIFWCDSKMRLDYEQYGDVVTFDTTYRINREGRPFAPFVGVNNHKQTMVFGAALMYDETKDSFTWVFESFLRVMCGEEPKTILTDQDHAMRSAISSIFKKTKHRLCVWHLHQNALKNLRHVYKRSSTFGQEFKTCIFDFEEEEEFLEPWENILDKYDLRGNEWLQETFKLREKWALVYGRHTFCADMKSTQLSESFNATLKRYLGSKLDVLRFFDHFERALDDVRHNELISNYDMTQKILRLMVDAILLRQARDIYTAKVFEWFQKEFERATNLVVSNVENNGAISVYRICKYGKSHEYFVTFNSSEDTFWCNCSKFEFVGILCCHVLKVFERIDVKIIPSKYIMKRWTKQATLKAGRSYERLSDGDVSKLAILNRYKDLSREANNIAELACHDVEDYEYFKRHLEEAKIELGKRKRSPENLNPTTETDLPQPVQCEEEIKLMNAKGLKVKQGGKRGGPRPKGPLEKGLKKRKKKNEKVTELEFATTSPYLQKMKGAGYNKLSCSSSSVYEHSNAYFAQGSSTLMHHHISNMPMNTYDAYATEGIIHGNQCFSSHSELLQQAMNQEIHIPYSYDYRSREYV